MAPLWAEGAAEAEEHRCYCCGKHAGVLQAVWGGGGRAWGFSSEVQHEAHTTYMTTDRKGDGSGVVH